ncbi:MAG: DUF4142 domain-containing protein [Actinobacteria bacterium]|nr:DUF4142 domain-containing protein [Actinomycetota bacterium]
MKKAIMLVMALAAIAGLSIPAAAGAEPYPGAQPTEIDQDWIQQALRIDLFEIKSGELAAKQAGNPQVAQLGAMLAREHAVAFAEDRTVAKEIGATVPTDPAPAMKSALQRLGEAKGAAFDKAYTEGEIEGHLEAIKAAEAEIAQGSDPTAVAAAAMNLEMYEAHLEAVRDVR